MYSAPGRMALAGSVFVLGTVGTVSAVHLGSPRVPQGTSTELSPLPVRQPATEPVARPPSASPVPRSAPSTRPRVDGSSTVSTRDLVELAAGPDPRHSVVVPLRTGEPVAPSRAVDQAARSGSRLIVGALKVRLPLVEPSGGDGPSEREGLLASGGPARSGGLFGRSGLFGNDGLFGKDGLAAGELVGRGELLGSEPVQRPRAGSGRHRA